MAAQRKSWKELVKRANLKFGPDARDRFIVGLVKRAIDNQTSIEMILDGLKGTTQQTGADNCNKYFVFEVYSSGESPVYSVPFYTDRSDTEVSDEEKDGAERMNGIREEAIRLYNQALTQRGVLGEQLRTVPGALENEVQETAPKQETAPQEPVRMPAAALRTPGKLNEYISAKVAELPLEQRKELMSFVDEYDLLFVKKLDGLKQRKRRRLVDKYFPELQELVTINRDKTFDIVREAYHAANKANKADAQ